jgi:hypothetical protein
VRFRIHVESWRTVKTWRNVWSNLWVLLGVDSLTSDSVFVEQRPDVVFEREPKSVDEIHHEEAFQLLHQSWFGNI